MTMSGRVMPSMMKGTLKTELRKLISVEETDRALKMADREYEGIVERTPDIGGDKNPFLSTLYVGAYAVAVYKAVKGQITVKQLEELIVDGMGSLDMLKKLAGKTDYLSAQHVKKERENAAWLEAHPGQGNWAFSVESADEKALRLCYRSCGLYEMVKREGVPEVALVLCRTDKLIYGLSGHKMVQEKSFEDGDGVCRISIQRQGRMP